MRVRIQTTAPGEPAEERIISSAVECRDEVELFAYRHVVECGGLDVRVGCVLAHAAPQQNNKLEICHAPANECVGCPLENGCEMIHEPRATRPCTVCAGKGVNHRMVRDPITGGDGVASERCEECYGTGEVPIQ